MDEGSRITLKTWKLQSRREIKKAREQAEMRNARSTGELQGKAFGEVEVGDVVEDAEYCGSAEAEEGVDPCPSQRWQEKLRKASESAGSAENPGRTSIHAKVLTGSERREASGRSREASADAEDHEQR